MTNEQDIPIDIHQNKLLDWLISRRHVNRDWQKAVFSIREKINNAIQDMPAVDEIATLLAGSYINYFHCCRIFEILKETEASSKNIFGQYSSQRMKDWLEIIQLYENNNVYLAEVAQMLTRNINYEIPSLKKQLSRCIQTQEECLRKKSDYARNAIDKKEKYFSACKQIGIEGKCVRKELLSLLDELPESIFAIANIVKILNSAKEFYKSFMTFTLITLNRNVDFCLPLISFIIVNGNTSTYEWRTGELPDVVEVTKPILPLDVDNGSTETGDDQIDFGDFAVTSESSDDRSSSSPNGDFVHVDKEDCKADTNDQIDFGDADTEANWDITVATPGITILESEDGSEGGKVARGKDALTLLENPVTRNMFYNELLELEGFLDQRLIEMSDEDDRHSFSEVLCSGQFLSAPSEVQLQSKDGIKDMLTDVKGIIAQLMSTKMKQLYLLKESPKNLDRLILSLKTALDSSEKMVLSKQVVEAKYQDNVEEQSLLEPKLSLIIEKTEELQAQIEADISKRYKGRPVNIMGFAISR